MAKRIPNCPCSLPTPIFILKDDSTHFDSSSLRPHTCRFSVLDLFGLAKALLGEDSLRHCRQGCGAFVHTK
jgi:hypothetical protein